MSKRKGPNGEMRLALSERSKLGWIVAYYQNEIELLGVGSFVVNAAQVLDKLIRDESRRIEKLGHVCSDEMMERVEHETE